MFKKEFLYEIEINPTKYDPPIPKFYKSEECMDLRNIVEHRGGSKKKYNYKHPVEHNKVINKYYKYSRFSILCLTMQIADRKNLFILLMIRNSW